MDFRNGTSEQGILPPQGVFPETAVHKIPAHGEIKGGGEERNAVWQREKGRRAERDTGERFGSAASHPLRVTVKDLKNLSVAPQQLQEEECSWGDKISTRCAVPSIPIKPTMEPHSSREEYG